jgi:hypothetical protein
VLFFVSYEDIELYLSVFYLLAGWLLRTVSCEHAL